METSLAASLIGTPLPNVDLPSTDGVPVNPSKIEHRSVIFCYPYTGRPGVADPPGWDGIPGAHGSTPQAVFFSTLCPEFQKLGVKIYGLSFQSTAWQCEFVTRNTLAYPLLSDEKQEFARALSLRTFMAGSDEFLQRRTLICQNAVIIHDIQNIPQPSENARVVLGVLGS